MRGAGLSTVWVRRRRRLVYIVLLPRDLIMSLSLFFSSNRQFHSLIACKLSNAFSVIIRVWHAFGRQSSGQHGAQRINSAPRPQSIIRRTYRGDQPYR